jgi:glycosyltransferase involved in cell wall biosynthesis
MVLEREFPPDVRVEKEALTLIESSYEVHICSYNFSNLPEYELVKGMHIHRISVPRQFFKKFPLLMNVVPVYPWVWHHSLKKIMKRIKFDILHVHDLPLCGVGRKLSSQFGIPFIADMHENYPYLIYESPFMKNFLVKAIVNFPKWLRLESKWLADADYVITTCEGMKNRLVNKGIEGSKIFVVENTISLTDVTPEETFQEHEGKILIYVGGISDDRGLQYALEGLNLLQAGIDVQLWIVGDGSYKIQLEKLLADKKIRGVTFWGWKSRAEAFQLIKKADIGLISQIKSVQSDNASPNKLFEYFVFSKPVLASDCDAVAGIIEESGAGAVYRYNSPESFARSLEALLNLNLNELGNNGRQIVLRKYNWENTKTSLLELYDSI